MARKEAMPDAVKKMLYDECMAEDETTMAHGSALFQNVSGKNPVYFNNPKVQAFLDSEQKSYEVLDTECGKFVLIDNSSMSKFDALSKFITESKIDVAIDDAIFQYFMKSKKKEISLTHHITKNVVQLSPNLMKEFCEWREEMKNVIKNERSLLDN